VLVAAWANWVTFPLVGHDYESAIITGAFCGFAIGATATAIANMQALTRRHGAADLCHRADRRRVLYRPDQPGCADVPLVPGVYHRPINEVEAQARHRISAGPPRPQRNDTDDSHEHENCQNVLHDAEIRRVRRDDPLGDDPPASSARMTRPIEAFPRAPALHTVSSHTTVAPPIEQATMVTPRLKFSYWSTITWHHIAMPDEHQLVRWRIRIVLVQPCAGHPRKPARPPPMSHGWPRQARTSPAMTQD
jgi:hypothetical protein